MNYQHVHFIASTSAPAQSAMRTLARRYGQSELGAADVIVALGGDGFMLRTLHRLLSAKLPVYGMKLGNVGFLMNRYNEKDLLERLSAANVVELAPLCMLAVTEGGGETRALAINEVSLLRQMNQAAHIRVMVNGMVKVKELVCVGTGGDGRGRTAYNLSAHGLLPGHGGWRAPASLHQRWRGAVLPSSVRLPSK
jgi:NAD+ kinase